MKYFLPLFAVILAVTAVPVPLEVDYDPARQPDAFTTNANYTLERVPAGQAGFATLNGGTIGGNGGTRWVVWDPWALRDSVTGNNRREIFIEGRIDLTPLFTGSPGIRLIVGSNKSIYGTNNRAMIHGGGLRINNARQIIIQDLRFHNCLSYKSGETPNGNGGITTLIPGPFSEIDSVEIRNSLNVWINHCEFADDPWNSASLPANLRRHDGLVDIVAGSNWVTVSNSIFRNHNYVALIGNGDGVTSDRGRLKTTYFLNWFQGTVQRNPRIRFAEVHMLNNLYTDVSSYGIGLGFEARVYAERNYFVNTRRAWGWASGQPSSLGFLVHDNNWFSNSAFDAGIPSNGVNFRPNQYYAYTPMAAARVEDHVRRTAGPR